MSENTIVLNKSELESRLECLLENEKFIRYKLNASNASSRIEVENRLELQKRQEVLQDIINELGIQMFEYNKEGCIQVEII